MRQGNDDRGSEKLRSMDPEARRAFCRQVLESLSELVEGEAPEELCRQVEEILGDCQPFLAYRNTFAATLRLARELGEPGSPLLPAAEASLARCLARLRRERGRPEEG